MRPLPLGATLGNSSRTGEWTSDVASQEDAQSTTGLLSLPTHLLALIARTQPPTIRAACAALRDAYGPLHLALDLATPSHQTAEVGAHYLLENLFHPNPHITTLTLPDLSFYPTLPAAAAARFPALHTLSWPTYTPPSNAALGPLAPLHATLTALHLHRPPHPLASPPPPPPARPPVLTALTPLTSLRSLSLPCALPPPGILLPFHLAPLANLPHLHTLALLPPHPRSASDDPLPLLAAATPHLTSLTVPAWFLCGRSSAATLAPSPTTWPHLHHLHLHFDHPPPADPLAIPNCTAAVAALNTRESLASAVSATVHLPCLAGVAVTSKFSCLGWLEAIAELQVRELAVTFPEQQLPLYCEGAACLWAWLEGQASLAKLAIHDPTEQAPRRRHATDVPSPYQAVASLAACLEDLHLGLHWSQDFSQFVSDGLGQLTCLTKLSFNDSPTPRWEEDADDFDFYGLDALTNLVELQMGNLRATAFTSATHLPRLRALTILDCRSAETVGHSDCWELSCLTALAGTLTRLELQGLPCFQFTGLGVLRTLSSLRELRLTSVNCLAAPVAACGRPLYASRVLSYLLPLPQGLRSLVLAGASLHLSPAHVRQLMEAVGAGCRVKVDFLERDGAERSLDTKYGIGPVRLGPQWQVKRRGV